MHISKWIAKKGAKYSDNYCERCLHNTIMPIYAFLFCFLGPSNRRKCVLLLYKLPIHRAGLFNQILKSVSLYLLLFWLNVMAMAFHSLNNSNMRLCCLICIDISLFFSFHYLYCNLCQFSVRVAPSPSVSSIALFCSLFFSSLSLSFSLSAGCWFFFAGAGVHFPTPYIRFSTLHGSSTLSKNFPVLAHVGTDYPLPAASTSEVPV